MGTDQWIREIKQSREPECEVMAITGHKIYPSYDLHHPLKRPLHHVSRSTSGNLKYPVVKMSLPMRRHSSQTQSHFDQKLKFDDFFNYADRTRAKSSCSSRRITIENGRRSVQSRLEMSRPQSCVTSSSLKKVGPLLPRRSTMDSISFWPSYDHPTRSVSVADSEMSNVQQHCCELMGPSVCSACSKKNMLVINRSQSSLSDYRVTTENIATVTMVQRMMPHMTKSEIQEQLDNGGICKLQRVNCWNRDKYNNEENGEDEAEGERSRKPTLNLAKLRFQKMVQHKTTPNFFKNIRQLNQKVVSGTVDLDENRFFPIKKEPKRTESPYPVFVSPKKNCVRSEPKFKAYYEPPLLEKENQTDPFAPSSVTSDSSDALLRQQPIRLDSDSDSDIFPDCLSTSRLEDEKEEEKEDTEKAPFDPPLLPKENQIEEPSFFAGSVIPYTLPERAPDKLGSFDMSRLNGELTSSESENEC